MSAHRGWVWLEVGLFAPESRAGFASLLALALLVMAATRLPLTSPYLYSQDEVNFARALDDFDPRMGQPQPPAYPLLVALARLLRVFFIHPEHIFISIALATSALVLPILVLLGRRMAGPGAGWWAAGLLLLNPVFWFSGLTSPSRPQLALLTALVGYTCWRAWQGERRWVYWGALALGLGTGFRPSLLALLFPLWAACAWRHRPAAWRGLGLLALAAGCWLLPLMWAMGGPLEMARGFWQYLAEQSAPTSPLFGASLTGWRFMVGRAFVWNAVGLLMVLTALPLAWGRIEWRSLGGGLVFFALWTGPCFLFQVLIHIAVPDHALTTIPALCVLGGALLARTQFAASLTLGALALNTLLFLYPYRPPQSPAHQPRASLLRSVRDAGYYGTVQTSYRVVQGTEFLARRALSSLARVTRVEPPPVLVWKGANFGWRRTIFYLPGAAAPGTSVIVLRDREHVEVKEPLAEWWENGRMVRRLSGQSLHIPLPAHRRVVWMVRAQSDFTEQLAQRMPLKSWGNILYTEPFQVAGSFPVGDFIFDIVPDRNP